MKTKAYLALFLTLVPGLVSAEPRQPGPTPGIIVSEIRLFENQPVSRTISQLSGAKSDAGSRLELTQLRFQQYERALPPNQPRPYPEMDPNGRYRESRPRVYQDYAPPVYREAPLQAPAQSLERTRQRQYQRGANGAPYMSANAVNARQDMAFFPGGEDGENAPWDPLLLILLILSLGLFLCLISVLQRLRDKIFDEY